jgi:hypothetical protein
MLSEPWGKPLKALDELWDFQDLFALEDLQISGLPTATDLCRLSQHSATRWKDILFC